MIPLSVNTQDADLQLAHSYDMMSNLGFRILLKFPAGPPDQQMVSLIRNKTQGGTIKRKIK